MKPKDFEQGVRAYVGAPPLGEWGDMVSYGDETLRQPGAHVESLVFGQAEGHREELLPSGDLVAFLQVTPPEQTAQYCVIQADGHPDTTKWNISHMGAGMLLNTDVGLSVYGFDPQREIRYSTDETIPSTVSGQAVIRHFPAIDIIQPL
jgi:hypothetical protein